MWSPSLREPWPGNNLNATSAPGSSELSRLPSPAFEAQPRDRRERWSRSGTSLSTAKTLDGVAERLLARLSTDPAVDLDDLSNVLDFILDDETLNTLLGLPENSRRGFKSRRNAPRNDLVDVNLRALILDWVEGVEIQDLADVHLNAIDDEGYRSESVWPSSAPAC